MTAVAGIEPPATDLAIESLEALANAMIRYEKTVTSLEDTSIEEGYVPALAPVVAEMISTACAEALERVTPPVPPVVPVVTPDLVQAVTESTGVPASMVSMVLSAARTHVLVAKFDEPDEADESDAA